MVREAHEEAWVKLDVNDLKVVHLMHRFATPNPENLQERVDVFFKVEKWKGEPKNMEPNKCDGVGWCSIDKIPENTMIFVKQMFKNYKKIYFIVNFDSKIDNKII